MATTARWAAPESPIWLLDSERKSKERFSSRPWETKQEEDNTSAVMRGTYSGNTESILVYTCAIWVAPASPIELNARLSDRRFLLADLVVERADPIRRASSSPIRLFLRDKWVRLDQKDAQHESGHVCDYICVWGQIKVYLNKLCSTLWDM